MGMQILAEEYMRKTGIPWKTLKDLRSPANEIILNKVKLWALTILHNFFRDVSIDGNMLRMIVK